MIGGQSGFALPWPHIPEDQRHFQEITWGHKVIMGRKTFETLPRRPLKGRANIVLTTRDLKDNQITIIHDRQAIKQMALDFPLEPIFIIGGKQLFQATLPWVFRLYQTVIKGSFQGDTYMTKINYSDFKLVAKQEIKSQSGYLVTFRIFERIF